MSDDRVSNDARVNVSCDEYRGEPGPGEEALAVVSSCDHSDDDGNDHSASGSAGSASTPEEERFKKLFSSCDTDGDGYIDSNGLALMCRQLNMEDSADEIMMQLGLNNEGRISVEDFLKCRVQLMGEIEALTSVMEQQSTFTHKVSPVNQISPLTTSSDQGIGINQNIDISKWPTSGMSDSTLVKQEHWEFDSGARDLSPEPNTLQKLVAAAGGNVTAENSSTLLDLANKLHLAALASLKGEIFELSNRLQHLSQDRDLLEKQLTKAQLERIQLTKCNDDRLDQQAQRYEERITELHSVIAELSKKLNHHHNSIIREEDEESHQSEAESRQSRITSNDNNANESCSERDTEDANPELSQLVSDLHSSVQLARTMETSQHTITELSQVLNETTSTHENQQKSEFTTLNSIGNNLKAASTQSLQMYQLHDDIRVLRMENKQLREQISNQDVENSHARLTIGNLRDDRDRLRRKAQELQSKLQILQNSQGSIESNQTVTSSASPARSKSPHVNSTTGERTPTSKEDPALVTKMAERVKLKKMECGDKYVLGSEISSVGISSTKIAEHLVQHLHEESSAQEILQALCASGSNVSKCKVKEFEVETERLNSKIDHLKSQNDLLSLTLEESRTQCDRLSVLIGKYESNSTALQLAHNYSDQCLETFEVLVTLLESEQGLLLANCRAAGLGGFVKGCGNDDQDEVTILLKRAHENRKTAENLARHLLQRLDRNCSAIYGVSGALPNPWDDMSSHNTSTSSTSSGSVDSEFTKGDEQRLREYIHQLKSDRASVRVTITELESVHIDPLAHEHSLSILESQKLDLENAVLMQELMAMKEEKAELKAQVYLYEKEKSALELRLNTREAQEQAYRVHIDHLKAELQDKDQIIKRLNEYIPTSNKGCLNDLSNSGQTFDLPTILGELPKDMIEAARREKKLKNRIQELVTTLEKVTRNSELRHQQSADFVNDLKRANTAIIGAFERSKKKHQSKLKKIEQQMLAMIERHNNQVRVLRQKLNIQEEEKNTSCKPGETAL